MEKNKKLLIVAGIGISILISLFLWNNKNDDFFITGQVSKVSFNNSTVWPEILPENFNPEEIMELGKFAKGYRKTVKAIEEAKKEVLQHLLK